jgi:hypothetical protein
MQNNSPPTGKEPQMTPEIQAKIGQQLRKIYDDMVNQGVPDRFVDLLGRLEANVDPKVEKPGHKPSKDSR